MQNNRRSTDKQPQLSTKVAMLEKDFKNFEERYDRDQEVNEDHWRNFYAFKEELLTTVKKPSSFKDIIIAVSATVAVCTAVVGAILTIVDSRIAVPVEQGKVVSHKVEELASRQNEILNLVSLQSAKLSTVVEKVNSNTDFVDEYVYREKVPSVITALQKDIEYLKLKE